MCQSDISDGKREKCDGRGEENKKKAQETPCAVLQWRRKGDRKTESGRGEGKGEKEEGRKERRVVQGEVQKGREGRRKTRCGKGGTGTGTGTGKWQSQTERRIPCRGQKRSFCVRKIILKNITNIKSATRKSIGSGRRREAARGRGKTKKAEGKARKEGAGQKMIARRASGKGESSAKREIAVSL